MYYQPQGDTHIPTKDLYRFQDPKRRHHEMTVAFTQGGPVLAVRFSWVGWLCMESLCGR